MFLVLHLLLRILSAVFHTNNRQGVRINGRADGANEISFIETFKPVQGPTSEMPGPLEQSEQVQVGDEIVAVNGLECAVIGTAGVFQLIKNASVAVNEGKQSSLSLAFRRRS
jgi:hypothetical protein